MQKVLSSKWKDEELVMISALEHYSYCPRQCALIHVEKIFDENIYTMRGHRVHEKVDQPDTSLEKQIRVERALPIWCDELGLVGKADVVEWHDNIPYPVEYKHGPRRQKEHDDIQLCAQALCLEEMTGQPVPKGAIYHHSSHRRREVTFTKSLRQRVVDTTIAIRKMINENIMPPPVNDQRCKNCSLNQSCLPEIAEKQKKIQQLKKQLFETEVTDYADDT